MPECKNWLFSGATYPLIVSILRLGDKPSQADSAVIFAFS
jgi:hypothetical protein